MANRELAEIMVDKAIGSKKEKVPEVVRETAIQQYMVSDEVNMSLLRPFISYF